MHSSCNPLEFILITNHANIYTFMISLDFINGYIYSDDSNEMLKH